MSNWKNTLGVGIAVVVGLSMCGVCMQAVSEVDKPTSGNSARPVDSNPPPMVQAATPPDRADREQGPRIIETGKQFSLGSFSYKILPAKKKSCVGNRVVKECASKGAVFVRVPYIIRNDGKETETVLSSDFKVRDSQERTFSPASRAETALAMSGGSKDLFLSQLQPGIQLDTEVVFEVPEGSIPGLILIVPEKGLLSSGEIQVKLEID